MIRFRSAGVSPFHSGLSKKGAAVSGGSILSRAAVSLACTRSWSACFMRSLPGRTSPCALRRVRSRRTARAPAAWHVSAQVTPFGVALGASAADAHQDLARALRHASSLFFGWISPTVRISPHFPHHWWLG